MWVWKSAGSFCGRDPDQGC